MRNTDCDTQGCLPVALHFMTAEVKIPVGNAIKLRKHPFFTVLVNGGLCLFCSGKFMMAAKDIDAGDAHFSVVTHNLTAGNGLLVKLGLTKIVAGEIYAVFIAPFAYLC